MCLLLKYNSSRIHANKRRKGRREGKKKGEKEKGKALRKPV
jgi:hypothetical protein